MEKILTDGFGVGKTDVDIKYDTKKGSAWVFITKGEETMRLYFKNMSRLDTFATRLLCTATDLWVKDAKDKLFPKKEG